MLNEADYCCCDLSRTSCGVTDIVIPDETKASSAAASAWIKSNLSTGRSKARRNTANKPPRSTAPKSTAPKKRSRNSNLRTRKGAVMTKPAAPSPPPTTPYGPPITLEAAKKVMVAAEAEAVKNNWSMAIVILDSTGHMVMLHKFDNTQYGSLMAAEDKALSAINYRRPSKVFEDLVAQGGIGLRSLALRGASPLEGGIPLIVDGKVIGAIGVSGATSVQDGQVAKAGAEAAK